MEIIKLKDYNYSKGNIYTDIRFYSMPLCNMCRNIDKVNSDKIISFLNDIGIPIKNLDLNRITFSDNVPLDYCSSSEKVFILCELARIYNYPIYLYNHLKSLDLVNIQNLICEYKDDYNINIVVDDGDTIFYNYLNNYLMEVSNVN